MEEIIFCSRDVRAQEILGWMTRLGPSVLYKIVPEESLSIIGSSSKDEPGELYTITVRYNIAQPQARRVKRLFDLGLCLLLLVTLPLWLLFAKKRGLFLRYWLPVLVGRYTWVGYAPHPKNGDLPRLRPGVFSPVDLLDGLKANEATVGRLNFFYAKDWEVERDGEVVLGA